MSLYCKSCCQMLDDRRFSNAGRKSHICKGCNQLPAAERERRVAMEELAGFLKQKNLSATNVTRLKVLAKMEDETVRRKASTLLAVAQVHPHQSKRLPYLRDRHPELFTAFVEAFEIDLSSLDTRGTDAPPPEEPEAGAVQAEP